MKQKIDVSECLYEDSKKENQRLKEKANKVVEMQYRIDGSMDKKDMDNLWESIDALEDALEGKDE
jgi:hypothetical protein